MDPTLQVVDDAIKLIADGMRLDLGASTARRIEYLSDVSGAITSRIRDMAREFFTLNNEEIPISRLSMEILNEIFLQTTFVPQDSFQRSIVTLCLTCRRWKEVIERCPNLWTVVTSSQTPAFVQKSFENSRNLPISLLLLDDGGPNHWNGSLLAFAERIQTVNYVGKDLTVLASYMAYPVEFHIVFSDEGDEEGSSEDEETTNDVLSISSGPPLRSLTLRGLSVHNCDWDRLRALDYLELQNVTLETSSFLPYLLGLLSAPSGPRLVEISNATIIIEYQILDNATLNPSARTLGQSEVSIRTDRWEKGTRSDLCDSYDFPLSIYSFEPSDSYWIWIPQKFGHLISQVRKVNISLELSEEFYSIGPLLHSCLDWHLGTVGNGNPEQILSKVVELFQKVGLGRSAEISFTIDNSGIWGRHALCPFDVPTSVLEALGDVTSIETKGLVDLRPLFNKLQISTRESTWPCPKLQYIELHWDLRTLHEDFLRPTHPRWKAKNIHTNDKKCIFLEFYALVPSSPS